jgi:glycosyltransferase involved in cell wall biosynthesis
MKLIIQIPCYNEEESLPVTIEDLPKKIDGVDEIEILIVNDGSSDKTAETAEALANGVVNFKRNKGLAAAFMAGIDAALKKGADIIVNTDADNQYAGEDIEKLIRPILDGKADIVIGERPIMQTAHFSPIKKFFQRFGSWIVRVMSKTNIPDAPSGFRAYSREAALSLNVISEYTYTLETIIQAGMKKFATTSVPIRTNGVLRPSRLMSGMFSYIKRSGITIIRSTMMYKPMKFFLIVGSVFFLAGAAVFVRFLFFFFTDGGAGHVQSLIFAAVLIIMGFQTAVTGLLADIIAANRALLEDVQLRVRKMEYGDLPKSKKI